MSNIPFIAFEFDYRELERKEDVIVGDMIRRVLALRGRAFTPQTMQIIEGIKNRAREDMISIGGHESYLETVINSLRVSL